MAKNKSHYVRVYNNSKQMIPLHVRAPGANFYTSEQEVRIGPGQDVLLPKSHLHMDQVNNLQRRNLLKITYDSEEVEG